VNSKTAAYLLGESAQQGDVLEPEKLKQALHWEAVQDTGKSGGWRLRNQRSGRYFLSTRYIFCDRDHAFACWLGLGKKTYYDLIQVINPTVLAEEIFEDDEQMDVVAGDILVDVVEVAPDNLLPFRPR
jgi:hypothetical protein